MPEKTLVLLIIMIAVIFFFLSMRKKSKSKQNSTSVTNLSLSESTLETETLKPHIDYDYQQSDSYSSLEDTQFKPRKKTSIVEKGKAWVGDNPKKSLFAGFVIVGTITHFALKTKKNASN